MHQSVLLHESLDGLNLKAGSIFLDATINGAGHSEEIAKRFAPTITIVGLDLDLKALAVSKKRLAPYALRGARVELVQSNFRKLDQVLADLEISNINGALFDLGLSSNQLDSGQGETGRGFSFRTNEPLLMTFSSNPDADAVTARTVINDWAETTLADIIFGYGEEHYARRIAKAIVAARELKPIETTFDLVEIIRQATPSRYHHGRIHFATRTFQALRIAVNDELGSAAEGIGKAFAALAPAGRVAVISFHSLEDRLVKRLFADLEKAGSGRRITKKPLVPSPEEIAANPRARSAKLRIIEKI